MAEYSMMKRILVTYLLFIILITGIIISGCTAVDLRSLNKPTNSSDMERFTGEWEKTAVVFTNGIAVYYTNYAQYNYINGTYNGLSSNINYNTLSYYSNGTVVSHDYFTNGTVIDTVLMAEWELDTNNKILILSYLPVTEIYWIINNSNTNTTTNNYSKTVSYSYDFQNNTNYRITTEFQSVSYSIYNNITTNFTTNTENLTYSGISYNEYTKR
jgi:hypothetical protein